MGAVEFAKIPRGISLKKTKSMEPPPSEKSEISIPVSPDSENTFVLQVIRSSNMEAKSTICMKRSTTVGEFKKFICDTRALKPYQVRLWDCFQGALYAQLDNMSVTLEKAGIRDNQTIVIEEQSSAGKWLLSTNSSRLRLPKDDKQNTF
eukprot:TRINITY_DN9738_c0_g1_i1.p1 TRINITY_DN9738_c0_g1~~TRINITY_DN9738_c0_g1_i1.p1  ORF type:complete len:149 (+),score=52.21 TRINITY_DN9738_c0_g1_i1:157-603(+)